MSIRDIVFLLAIPFSGCATPYQCFVSGKPVYETPLDRVMTASEIRAAKTPTEHRYFKLDSFPLSSFNPSSGGPAVWKPDPPKRGIVEVSFEMVRDKDERDDFDVLLMYPAKDGSQKTVAVRAIFKNHQRVMVGGVPGGIAARELWGFIDRIGWLWKTTNPYIFSTLPADAFSQADRQEVRIADTAAFLASYGPLRTLESLRAEVMAAVKAGTATVPGADFAAEALHSLPAPNPRHEMLPPPGPVDPAYAAFAALPDFAAAGARRIDENADRAAALDFLRRSIALEPRMAPFLQSGWIVPDRLKSPLDLSGVLSEVSWALRHKRGLLRTGTLMPSVAAQFPLSEMPAAVEAYLARADQAVAAPADLKTRYATYIAALGKSLPECAIAADALIADLQTRADQAVREQRVATAIWIEKEVNEIDCRGHIQDSWLAAKNLWRSYSNLPWRSISTILPPFVEITGSGGVLLYPHGYSRQPTAGAPLSTIEVKLLEKEVGTPTFDPPNNSTVTSSQKTGQRTSAAWLAWKKKVDALTRQAEGHTVGDPLAGVTVGPANPVYSDRARVSADAARGMSASRAAEQERADREASSARYALEQLSFQKPPEQFEDITTNVQVAMVSQRYRVPVKLRVEFEAEGKKRLCEESGEQIDSQVEYGYRAKSERMITEEQAREHGLEMAQQHLLNTCLGSVVKALADAAEKKWRDGGGPKMLQDAALAQRHQSLMALGAAGALEEQARPLADEWIDKRTRDVISPDAKTPLDDLFRKAWGLPPR